MPTKYKIFLDKGVLPPYNPHQGASHLDSCEHLAQYRLSFPQFKMEWRPASKRVQRAAAPPLPYFCWQSGNMSHSVELTIGGSMESLVKMVGLQIENSLWNYVNFTLGNGFSWVFKTLKPMSFRELHPLDPGHDGISDEKKNSTNWQFSAKLHVNFTAGDHTL